MMKILAYKGHISNFKPLMQELGLDSALAADRDAREKAILLAAYEAWGGGDMGHHLHGKFAFALYDEKKESKKELRKALFL